VIAFRPALLRSFGHYRGPDFLADVAAGITVGVVALPLAMAFGIASGVTPAQGLITAILAGLVVAVFGGSRVQIAGPAGAFVGLLYTLGERLGPGNLLLATMLAGVMLFAAGALRVGRMIRYVPVAIVAGFTNGIAVIIALQQVRDFLGLPIERMPADFFAQIDTLLHHLHALDPASIALGSASLVILHFWPKAYAADNPGWKGWARHVPSTVIVLVVGIALVSTGLVQVPTIGSRFGGIPAGFPLPAFPDIDWPKIREVLIPAFSIALLCGIESLLCARMADSLIRERHDANQELMAQGLANLLVPLFGGIAATGTIARTVTNVRSGARSPVSGIVHSLTLAAIVLLAAPLAASIPLAVLAAILLFVAWHMGDWLAFGRIKVFSVAHRVLMVGTFVLTVVYDLTVAVQVGMGLACLLFLHRMAGLSHAQWEEVNTDPAPNAAPDKPSDAHASSTGVHNMAVPALDRAVFAPDVAGATQGVAVCRLRGPLFFGAVDRLESVLDATRPYATRVVLDMHEVSYLDTSALEVLEDFERVVRELGGAMAVVGAPENVASLIVRSGFIERLAGSRIHTSRAQALAHLLEAGQGG